jgi:hypothetical protein
MRYRGIARFVCVRNAVLRWISNKFVIGDL